MSKLISPPGWSDRAGDTQAFTGTSASKAIGMQGWVRFKAVGGAAHIVIDTTAATAATITSGNAETYALTDGWTLTIDVDGSGVQTATFNTADFSNIAAATAAEVAAVINTDVTDLTADGSSGSVVLTSDRLGPDASIEVTGGTANGAIGFSTSIVTGTGTGATTTDYPLTDGIPEDFFIHSVDAHVHVEGVGTDTGTLYWVGV